MLHIVASHIPTSTTSDATYSSITYDQLWLISAQLTTNCSKIMNTAHKLNVLLIYSQNYQFLAPNQTQMTCALMVGGACSPLGAKSSYLNSGSSTRCSSSSGGAPRTTAEHTHTHNK